MLALGSASELLLVSPTPWDVGRRWRFQNVRHIGAHPKGRYLLVLHQEGTTLRNATTGEDLRTLDAPVAFHPFVERLVTFDRRARRLELTQFDDTTVQRFEQAGGTPKPGTFALAPHGRELAAVSTRAEPQLIVWNSFTGRIKKRLDVRPMECNGLCWSLLGGHLLLLGARGAEFYQQGRHHGRIALSGACSAWPTDDLVTVHLETMKVVSRLHLAGGASAISPDGMLLAQESGGCVRVLPGPAAWPGE